MVEFRVLRCVQCQTFQVLQVTKTNKWKCKMCGLKQSVTKVYGQGSGADCRRHVQKFNSICGEITRTGEEQHLMSAAQTPVHSGFISPDDVVLTQQETGAGSRWSSFLDEPHEGVEDDVDNLPVVLATTDWAEYHGTRNTWRKRRAERNNGFSKLPGKKSKSFHDNMSMLDASCKDGDDIQYIDRSTDSSVEHVYSRCASSSLSSSKAYAANRFPVSSLAVTEDIGNNMNSPCQVFTRSKPGSASSVQLNNEYPSNSEYPSNNAYDHTLISKGLSKHASMNGLGPKKEMTNGNKTTVNSKLASKIPTNSKWGAFLETEQDDDDESVTCCEYSDNVTDSIHLVNSYSLSVGAELLMQENQSVSITHKSSSIDCSHDSQLQRNLESESTDEITESRPSDWLNKSRSNDWLKKSQPSDWLNKSRSNDWLKKSQPSDWLTDSVVTRTAYSTCTHSAIVNSSSGCEERGTFDLGLEICDEDLQL